MNSFSLKHDRTVLLVKVTGRTAELSGRVDTYYEKEQAEEVASRAPGVVEVRNRIKVAYDPPRAYGPKEDGWDLDDQSFSDRPWPACPGASFSWRGGWASSAAPQQGQRRTWSSDRSRSRT